MGRPRETFNKKEVRSRKEKKRKEKEQKRQARKEEETKSSLDDMIAYVDRDGNITSTPPDPDDYEEINPEDIEVSVPSKEDREEYDPVRKGRVTFFNEEKGYGFIRDLETNESVFVHVNQTLEPIQKDNVVVFEIEKGPKGPSATAVKLDK
ncbi:MAG TPA: cold shock domain-containing protein [Bacteroidales bacterium]|nr:cold shock domain-containing protein [Bacteroidales bacterium]HPE57911.1 cold shock domain-containing protein [Bacteroidales bacterium]HRX96488.1 cold shock domain-containing protein [Bacteroidales bacterium]